MKSNQDRKLALDAVRMSVSRREPQKTIVHSDQGTQYGCDAWRRFCKRNHLEPSMSRKGNCWDNAAVLSLFSSLKKARIRRTIYKTRQLAIADISDYIQSFYNPARRHSHLVGKCHDRNESEIGNWPSGRAH